MPVRTLLAALLLAACAASPPPPRLARSPLPPAPAPTLDRPVAELPPPDDAFAEALSGPFPDLDSYCTSYSDENPSWRCDPDSDLVTGPSRIPGDGGAVLEARILGRGDAEGFMECPLAVRTARGWFVAKTAPVCNGAGTSRIWLEVEAFEARGPRVAVRWVEVDSHSFDSNEGWLLEESRKQERVTCALRSDGVPACSFAVLTRDQETTTL
jgi:hypothetical protein